MSETKPNSPEKKPVKKKVEIRVTDRRPRFDEKEGAAPVKPSDEKRYPTFVTRLEARAQAAEAKLSEALDLLRRREADADEFRARLRKEMERRSQAQVESVLRELLEVLDSLDRGLSAVSSEESSAPLGEGLSKVRDQFLASLARQGVEPMRLLHTLFDPELAEAVAVTEAEGGEMDNHIVDEIRRGYLLNGQVLRPAQVRVARSPAPPSPPREGTRSNGAARSPAGSSPPPDPKVSPPAER